jgi:LmbE family N-acetylglucosaminyl deacetylase
MSRRRGLPRRVLAVGAQSDDIEVACAGTLVRFRDAGSEVTVAVACSGDHKGAPAEAAVLAALRQEEAEQAAMVLGAAIEFLDIGDAGLGDDPASRQRLASLLRRVRPDLVITHGPTDYHADHVAIGRLVASATWFAASPGHVTAEPPLDRPPALFFMDNLAGVDFKPTHLVDVSSTIGVKRRMLACHASELTRSDSGLSQLEVLAETLTRLRGYQCGVSHAEGFRPAPFWGRRVPEPVFP